MSDLPTLGILLPIRRYQQLLAGQTPGMVRRARLYRAEFGVRTLFAACSAIDPTLEQAPMAEVLGEDICQNRHILPQIWHNRIRWSTASEARSLRALNGGHRFVVFNETNRWSRGMVFDMLAAIPATAHLIPPPLPASRSEQGPTVPQVGCFVMGRSRMPTARSGYLMEWTDQRLRYQPLGRGAGASVHRVQVPYLLGALPKSVAWISQLSGRPVGPKGEPVEWRFYAHRLDVNTWELAGEVAKAEALPGVHPEQCWPVEEALRLTFGADGLWLADALRESSLAVARDLGLFMPGVAHLAIDFWLTETGTPQLIDVSGFYRIDWLRRIGDRKAVQRIRTFPARFALRILNGGVGTPHVGQGG